MTAKIRELSRLVRAASDFDSDVSELDRLSRALDEVEIEKESGFLRAQKLIGHFTEAGLRVGDGVKTLAKEFEEARGRAEKAAEIVAVKAAAFKVRQEQINQILERFRFLGGMARQLTNEISEARKNAAEHGEGNQVVTKYIPELDSRLNDLLEEAKKLKAEAKAAEMKTLEQNAESLTQNLAAAQKKISQN